MFRLNQIEDIVSERAQSVTEPIQVIYVDIQTLLVFYISIDIQQQKYTEKKYPRKTFTISDKTYQKVSKQQYHKVRTSFLDFMVCRGVIKSYKDWSPLCGSSPSPAHHPQNDNFKTYPTPLCSSKSHRYDNYDKELCIVSSFPYSHKANLFLVIHSLPLGYNQTNINELDNQGLEVEITIKITS